MSNDFFTNVLLSGRKRQICPTMESESLPFVFQADGHRLKNYRIYGADGGVGDLENDEYSIPLTLIGKNALDMTAETKTVNNVDFTVNSDYSVTADGAASGVSIFPLNTSNVTVYNELPLETGRNYVLSGCPDGGAASTYALYIRISTDSGQTFTYKTDIGNGVEFTHEAGNTYAVYIRIGSGVTANNLQFFPMIRPSGTDDTYETYKNVTYVITLDEPLGENEYVDFVCDGLPLLYTVNGTNALTVDTTVPPAKVVIQGYVAPITASRILAIENQNESEEDMR